MKISLRCFFALMRRNLIYRKRNIVGSLLEILCPVLFVVVLVAIKIAMQSNPDFKPQTIPAVFPIKEDPTIIMTMTDYLIGLRAKRSCNYTSDNFFDKYQKWPFEITKYVDNQNPFLKCDRRACTDEKVGEDARDLCEYLSLGVAPISKDNERGKERVESFKKFFFDVYGDIKLVPEYANQSFVQDFEDSAAIDEYIKDKDYGSADKRKIALAILFGDGDDKYDFLFTIRANSTNYNQPEAAPSRPASLTHPNTKRVLDEFAAADKTCKVDGAPNQGNLTESCAGQYIYNGVLSMQRLVGDWIHNVTFSKSKGYYIAEHGLSFVNFPTKEYRVDGFYKTINPYVPLIITLGLLYPVSAIIRMITVEKELKQKELMKMMSVSDMDIGWSWFLTFWLFHLITAVAMSATFTGFYSNSDFIYLFLLWFLGWTAIIVFSMFLASFFSKATTGTLVGLLVFFAGYFLTLAADFELGNSVAIKIICLHPIGAIAYALQEIGRLEDGGAGVTQTSYMTLNNVSEYNVNVSYTMLVVDSLMYGVLVFYFNRVIPSDFGQPLPWNFLFKLSYWNPKAARYNDNIGESEVDRVQDVPIEGVGEGLSQSIRDGRGIEIRNLRKTFGDKIAVNNLCLSMYSNQVTALLGHNGAGKTTTISMLTGMITPTSGYALVDGLDIRSNMAEIRNNIGICLQHDCLFPQLTVKEHIEFFARLKGMYEKYSRAEVAEKVIQSIEDVALLEKMHTWSKNLSGGMKRKLSVAIAFCGDSSTVLLDEPTSGMDPFSRRFTWNVIRQYRQDRCIILTTHFMDEADILGDRISIMAEGQLRCAGSSLFLKKQYGVGYQLTVEMFPRKSSSGEKEELNVERIDDKITRIVTSSVDQANPLSNVGTELSFQLPIGGSSQFLGMFEQLDREVDEQRIVTYGVSITTLDEVFLLVARGGGDHEPAKEKANPPEASLTSDDREKSVRSKMDLQENGLFFRHIGALFRKRALNFKRDKKAWMCSTILPTIFVLVGFITFAIPDKTSNYRLMTLDDYNKGISQDPINPIPINQANVSTFTCQPGSCVQGYKGNDPDSLIEFGMEGQDDYTYCGNGFFAETRFTLNCSINLSEEVAAHLGDRTTPIPQNVQDITESSKALYASADDFDATQYGALSMTHDPTSKVYGDDSYGGFTVRACGIVQDRGTDYFPKQKCQDYAGFGFVISYNYAALHAAPLFQGLADQAILRNGTGNDRFKVRPAVEPLPLTAIETGLTEEEASFPAWFLLVLSFPLISGTFGTFIVAEKANKAKHLQTVAGVKPTAYWLSSYMWDVMNYQLPCWMTIILMFAFNIKTFTTTDRGVVGGVIVSLILFGPASAGFTYCFSFLFQSPSMCQLFVIIFNFFIGLGGPLVQSILRVIGDPSNTNSPGMVAGADFIQWVLRVFPSFNVGNALFKCLNIRQIEKLAKKKITVWSPEAILYETIFQAIWCVAYLLLAILIDKWSTNPSAVTNYKKIMRFLCCRCFSRRKRTGAATLNENAVDDEDVIAENERVDSGEANNDLIVLSHLTKVYDTGKVAVDDLCLGIPPGQCFGLLGINGAGKTTAMAMLTAEFPPTSGDATLGGFSVTHDPEKTRRRIGYCPQFDAHFQNMTGREHVQLYASIKGVPPSAVDEAVDSKLAEVGLNLYDSNRLSQGYSGGMKRKLSVACATIGQPQIVFLDEPSTGMDPVARRDMWAVISEMVSGGNRAEEDRTSVILTTHAMEECEALCPRIGIMANGRLRCLGSAQRLKDRFGQGYQVETKVEFVEQTDEDYLETAKSIAYSSGKMYFGETLEGETNEGEDAMLNLESAADLNFNLEETIAALNGIDFAIAEMVNSSDPNGYAIYKNASSPAGCTLQELATFATTELRMLAVEKFFAENFEGHVLRERQDTKVRYEVSSEGTRISKIFATIERNTGALKLADYGVSQTSLEQVFNMHAAVAERLKHEALDQTGVADG